MQFFPSRSFYILILVFVFSLSEFAQNTRELSVGEGGSVEISNPYGRVNVRAEAVADGEKRYIGRLNTSSQNGVGEAAVKISGRTGHMVVAGEHGDIRNRVDLNLTLPERSRLKIETGAGAVRFRSTRFRISPCSAVTT